MCVAHEKRKGQNCKKGKFAKQDMRSMREAVHVVRELRLICMPITKTAKLQQSPGRLLIWYVSKLAF